MQISQCVQMNGSLSASRKEHYVFDYWQHLQHPQKRYGSKIESTFTWTSALLFYHRIYHINYDIFLTLCIRVSYSLFRYNIIPDEERLLSQWIIKSSQMQETSRSCCVMLCPLELMSYKMTSSRMPSSCVMWHKEEECLQRVECFCQWHSRLTNLHKWTPGNGERKYNTWMTCV